MTACSPRRPRRRNRPPRPLRPRRRPLARARQPQQIEEARKTLQRLVEDIPPGDRWRAEAAESLGDLLADTRFWQEREAAIESWMIALDYWSKSTDLESARPHYLELNFKIADRLINQYGILPLPRTPRILQLDLILPPAPPENQPWRADTASWALRNILRVTQEPEPRAHALLLLGRIRANNRNNDEQWNNEAEDYLKQAADLTPVNEWTDDALWELAGFYNNHSRYVEAAVTYQRLFNEFDAGRTPFRDNALEMYRQITSLQVSVHTSQAFAPASYIPVNLNYRNANGIVLRLVRIAPRTGSSLPNPPPTTPSRPSRAARKSKPSPSRESSTRATMHRSIRLSTSNRARPAFTASRCWRRAPPFPDVASCPASAAPTAPPHGSSSPSPPSPSVNTTAMPTSGSPTPSPAPPPSPPRCNSIINTAAETIPRAAGASPAASPATTASSASSSTLPRPANTPTAHMIALAMRGDQPAVLHQRWFNFNPYVEARDEGRAVLHVYTTALPTAPANPSTGRPSVRFTDGKAYRLPAAESVYIRVYDGRNQLVHEGPRTVSGAGTVHGSFTLDRTAALGMLSIEISNRQTNATWAQRAQLARLEEYKLPEYKVSVEPAAGPQRLGQAVQFDIAADYYFGGPVTGATVDVVVHRRPFWPQWTVPLPCGWMDAVGGSPHMMRESAWGGSRGYWPGWQPEEIVHQETLDLGPEGRVTVTAGGLTDEEVRQALDQGYWGYAYRVEARVVDASRREVSASGEVKLANTAFAAYLTPQRFLYLPGDTVKVDLRTLDPNDRPVPAQGRATMFKRVWDKEKRNDAGEVEPGWVDTELFSQSSATGADGTGVIEFEPERDGYYLVRWQGLDAFGKQVTGETTLFVANEQTSTVGFRSGGVEIVTDRKTYERGDTIQALITVRRPNAAVWFAAEAEAQLMTRVVRPDGDAALVSIPVTAEFEPTSS